MERVVEAPQRRTVADLLRLVERLGGIPPERVRLGPPPGTATEADVLRVLDREGRPCELVDGTLVEKAMGLEESRLAMVLGFFLESYRSQHDLGNVTGPDGTLKLVTGLLRIPDIAFIAWGNLPGRRVPSRPVPRLELDLAVEILSRGNTRAETDRKLREYFEAGTRLVWVIDARRRTARSYTAPRRFTRIAEDGALDGGEVLPGFRLPLTELFARMRQGGAR